MTPFTRFAPVCLVIGLLAVPAPALASTPKCVTDNASLFHLETVKAASRDIKALRRQYDRDLVIETFRKVPPSVARQIQGQEPEAVTATMNRWAKTRARDLGPQTILVLICKEPAPLRIWVELGTGDPSAKDFAQADADQLRDRLVGYFNKQQYDAGLRAAVAFVRDRLAANPVQSQADRWLPVIWVLLPLAGLWLALEVVQHLTGGRKGKGFAVLGPVGYGGGGSFAAGLFTTMTTSWLQALIAGPDTDQMSLVHRWIAQRSAAKTTLTYHGGPAETGTAEPGPYVEDSYHGED